MRNAVDVAAHHLGNLPISLSPAERSALRRRWRPVIPLAIAIISLASLVFVLLRVEQRTRASLADRADLVDPARAAVTAIELTLALENSGAYGYMLSGDPRFVANQSSLRTTRVQAEERLIPLARRLGPRIAQPAMVLVGHLRIGDATFDSLYNGRLTRQEYTRRLEGAQARFAATIAEAGQLEAEILRRAAERRREFAVSQGLSAGLSLGLVVGACIALALLARLGLGFQARAILLDAREQQHAALREVARGLNASRSVGDAARIIADGALAATSALGAIVELAWAADEPERAVERRVALRDGPMRSTSAPYQESLTQMLIDAGGGSTHLTPEALLDRMAVANAAPLGALGAVVIPVVSDRRVRGALAIVRPRASVRVTESEDSYFEALMDLASAMLGRIELVSRLRTAERRFRQVAENLRGYVWLQDPASSKFLYVNAAYEKIWGRSRESLYRDPASWHEGVHPEDRARVAAVVGPGHTEVFEIEYRVVRPSGEVRWVWSRGFPVPDDRGEGFLMAGVAEDITEWRTAAESRARLVRGFTHDVKNPLGAADGFLSLLEEGVFGALERRQRDSVARARNSIRRALELITGVLELARVDAGELVLHPTKMHLRDIVKELTLEFRAQAEAKGQDMMIELGDDVSSITSDPHRIRQIVGNLLSNAIKYTPADGRIEVRVADAKGRAPAAGDWVVVDVIDSGPGIPPDKLSVVFDEFTRLKPGIGEGVGVGLAISKRLAQALGGRLTVESREGEGSRFSLWLPRHAANDASAIR